MKRIIIKTLSLSLAVIFILLALMSCDPTTDQGEQNSGNNNTNAGSSSTSHYYGVKTLYSYDDVMDALAIVRQRRTVKPTYTVKDMGEDYTIFYQFWEPHYNRQYPIDYDVFFTSQSSGFFYTYIFLENQTCSHEEHSRMHSLQVYKEDEDYENLKNQRNKAYVRFATASETFNRYGFYEIEYKERLYYTEIVMADRFQYVVRYGGNAIVQLWSCIELDDEFFDVFFESLVTTSVK